MVLCVLGHQTHSQSGLADFHNWELNTVHMNSEVHHQPCHQSANEFIANEQWQNGTRVPENFPSVLLQLPPQVVVVFHDLGSQLFPHLRPQNSQVGQ